METPATLGDDEFAENAASKFGYVDEDDVRRPCLSFFPPSFCCFSFLNFLTFVALNFRKTFSVWTQAPLVAAAAADDADSDGDGKIRENNG